MPYLLSYSEKKWPASASTVEQLQDGYFKKYLANCVIVTFINSDFLPCVWCINQTEIRILISLIVFSLISKFPLVFMTN